MTHRGEIAMRIDDRLEVLVKRGHVPQPIADHLEERIEWAFNEDVPVRIVVAGPTKSGKSTLLSAMINHFNRLDRVILVERADDLDLNHRQLPAVDCVSLHPTAVVPLARLPPMAPKLVPDWLLTDDLTCAEVDQVWDDVTRTRIGAVTVVATETDLPSADFVTELVNEIAPTVRAHPDNATQLAASQLEVIADTLIQVSPHGPSSWRVTSAWDLAQPQQGLGLVASERFPRRGPAFEVP
jgi:hypothetical protein